MFNQITWSSLPKGKDGDSRREEREEPEMAYPNRNWKSIYDAYCVVVHAPGVSVFFNKGRTKAFFNQETEVETTSTGTICKPGKLGPVKFHLSTKDGVELDFTYTSPDRLNEAPPVTRVDSFTCLDLGSGIANLSYDCFNLLCLPNGKISYRIKDTQGDSYVLPVNSKRADKDSYEFYVIGDDVAKASVGSVIEGFKKEIPIPGAENIVLKKAGLYRTWDYDLVLEMSKIENGTPTGSSVFVEVGSLAEKIVPKTLHQVVPGTPSFAQL